MKTSLKLITSVASFAALLTGAFAQTSAVTDPVGYITVNVAPKQVGSSGSITLAAPTLVQKIEFQGVPSVDPSGLTTITFSGGVPTLAAGRYYAEIATKDHANEGFWATINSTTATTVVISKPIPAGSASVNIAIRKHQTVTSFAGPANALNLDPGEDTGSADTIQLFSSATQTLGTQYFFGDTALGAEAVWYDENGLKLLETVVDVNTDTLDPVIPPGTGVIVTRRKTDVNGAGGVIVGHVKTTKTKIDVVNGLNVIEFNRAAGGDFASSGLDTGIPATGLLRGEDTGGADFMEFLPALNALDLQFFAGISEGNPIGFVNQNGDAKGDTNVKEGTAILLTRKGGNGTLTVNRAPITTP